MEAAKMDAESRLRKELKLLKSDITEYSGNLQREIMRELVDEEAKLRMAAMARSRAPASRTGRALHNIRAHVDRMLCSGRQRLTGA